MPEKKEQKRGGKRVISKEGGQRCAEATRIRWKKNREQKDAEQARRKEVERKAQLNRRLREMCKDYNEQPITGMTEAEVADFAVRQSKEASRIIRIKDGNGHTRRMSHEEQAQFAAAISASINYFNARSKDHNRVLDYRDKCRRMAEQERQRRAEMRRQSKNLVIHFM